MSVYCLYQTGNVSAWVGKWMCLLPVLEKEFVCSLWKGNVSFAVHNGRHCTLQLLSEKGMWLFAVSTKEYMLSAVCGKEMWLPVGRKCGCFCLLSVGKGNASVCCVSECGCLLSVERKWCCFLSVEKTCGCFMTMDRVCDCLVIYGMKIWLFIVSGKKFWLSMEKKYLCCLWKGNVSVCCLWKGNVAVFWLWKENVAYVFGKEMCLLAVCGKEM